MFWDRMDERGALGARIGSAIRKRRRACGWSQEHLAELAEVSTHFVGLIERGRELPSLTTLLNLAEVLGVSFEDLVRATPRPEEAWEVNALAALRGVPPALRDGVMAMLEAFARNKGPRKRPRRAKKTRRPASSS